MLFRSRERSSLDVVVSAACAIDENPKVAKRWNAGLVGFYATVKTYAEFFEFHGMAEAQDAVIAKFKTGISSDQLGDIVPDEMVDAMTLSGTAEYVRSRIAEYEGLADTIKLTPPTHGLPPDMTRKAQNQILEMIPLLTGGV